MKAAAIWQSRWTSGTRAEVLHALQRGALRWDSELEGQLLLGHAARVRRNTRILKYLLETGAAVDAIVNGLGQTAMHVAANVPRNVVNIRYLAHQHARVDATDADGRTPLVNAVLSRSPENVSELLAFHASPNIETIEGETPLSFCVAWSIRNSAALLCQANANVNHRVAGDTPLIVQAACNDDLKTLRLLLAHGADCDATSGRSGLTALMIAIIERRLPIARVLWNASDRSLKDNVGLSAEDYAAAANLEKSITASS
ncbi:MAG: ankyrin repeat domain-containing protein [Phycisphaerae bacterium]|nr:ankyrin repeat domain-containing protein [Phycisphaerae bacterium]